MRSRSGSGGVTRRDCPCFCSRRLRHGVAQLAKLGFGEGLLLEELLRPDLERGAVPAKNAERFLVRALDDAAHGDVDLARGLLAELAVALRQRPAEERRALLF